MPTYMRNGWRRPRAIPHAKLAPAYTPDLLEAPLRGSIVPLRGATVTFTRASIATVQDFEGVTRLCKSGEARFWGLRRVENLFSASTTLVTQSVTVPAGIHLVQFRGTGSVVLSGAGTGTITGSGVSSLSWALVTTTAGTLTATVTGSCTSGQLESVTGQSVQTPGEYVSTGVLSWPFHGAGVDGVKYFDTTLAGAAISGGGYLAEPSRTNLLINSDVPVTQSVTTSAGSVAVSHYGTGTCTLSGTATGVLTGTGANARVSTVVTATAGTLTLTYAGSNTKGQVEAGATVTSYIPTAGVPVTRAADVLNYALTSLPANNLTFAATITKLVIPTTSNPGDSPFSIGGFNTNGYVSLGGYSPYSAVLGADHVVGSWPTTWSIAASTSGVYPVGQPVRAAWSFDADGKTWRSSFSGSLLANRVATVAKIGPWFNTNLTVGGINIGANPMASAVNVVSNLRVYSNAHPPEVITQL